mmetsp:Transcript_11223/g.22367  ORF Transcript_11223/g.22367 Transcript_11223/m.22367 type:complete len:86 (+) Transcript_11223:6737-6994(+)
MRHDIRHDIFTSSGEHAWVGEGGCVCWVKVFNYIVVDSLRNLPLLTLRGLRVWNWAKRQTTGTMPRWRRRGPQLPMPLRRDTGPA